MTSLYEPLPPHIKNNLSRLDLKGLPCSANKFVEAFLKKQLPCDVNVQQTYESMKLKGLMLDSINTAKKKKKSRRLKTMNAHERRERGIFKISKENQRYELYIPLHELWRNYINEALQAYLKNSREAVDFKSLYPKLLKADYHGAIITVSKSKCPGYVGLTGILLQETKNTFRIITKEDKMKTIPKANSVFIVEMEGYRITIFGNQLRIRSAERSSKKFKSKPTTDL